MALPNLVPVAQAGSGGLMASYVPLPIAFAAARVRDAVIPRISLRRLPRRGKGG
ncbi:MAG TPA: hypothetical protein VHX66_02430 [Solirubrobacteraceae bacterium]|nr:hypothetical protein [Solirubrobacteraceae bacterium]